MFQGDDHLSQQPFRFFADYEGKLRHDVWKNREREAISFGGFPPGFGPEDIPDPSNLTTFLGCKLTWDNIEGEQAIAWRNFVKRLLEVRRTHVVPLLGPDICGGNALATFDNCMFVDWTHASGTLRLRANLGSNRVFLGEDIATAVEIYPAKSAASDRALNGRSVRVFLD